MLMKCKLNFFVEKNELLTNDSDIKIWSDESKVIMEFANLLIGLYNQKYKVNSSWFSTDKDFNSQIDAYNKQKKEVKEIVQAFKEEEREQSRNMGQSSKL